MINQELVIAPDLILYKAKIITVDENFTIAEAVAIKDGRFVAVGTNHHILSLAKESTKKVDLQGKTLIPGLIDPTFRTLNCHRSKKHS